MRDRKPLLWGNLDHDCKCVNQPERGTLHHGVGENSECALLVGRDISKETLLIVAVEITLGETGKNIWGANDLVVAVIVAYLSLVDAMNSKNLCMFLCFALI